MDVQSALKERRSTRQFKPDPVAAELIQACLEDARWAPSWSNTEPYRVAVAQGTLRDRLSSQMCALFEEVMALQRASVWKKVTALLTGKIPRGDYHVPREYPQELQAARRSCGLGLYKMLGIERSDHVARERQLRRNYEFFGAPVVVFLFAHEGLGSYSVLDAGLFLQSFLLACHSRGLATCAQGALAICPGPVREAFAVPKHYKLLVGCSVGYADSHPVNAFNPGRAPLSDLLLSERTPTS
jgi:nitroreductase